MHSKQQNGEPKSNPGKYEDCTILDSYNLLLPLTMKAIVLHDTPDSHYFTLKRVCRTFCTINNFSCCHLSIAFCSHEQVKKCAGSQDFMTSTDKITRLLVSYAVYDCGSHQRFDKILSCRRNSRPPLWSSGQSFWLQIQRSRVRSPALPDFLSSSVSGTGSTQPCEFKLRSYLNKKSSVNGRGDPLR